MAFRKIDSGQMRVEKTEGRAHSFLKKRRVVLNTERRRSEPELPMIRVPSESGSTEFSEVALLADAVFD